VKDGNRRPASRYDAKRKRNRPAVFPMRPGEQRELRRRRRRRGETSVSRRYAARVAASVRLNTLPPVPPAPGKKPCALSPRSSRPCCPLPEPERRLRKSEDLPSQGKHRKILLHFKMFADRDTPYSTRRSASQPRPLIENRAGLPPPARFRRRALGGSSSRTAYVRPAHRVNAPR